MHKVTLRHFRETVVAVENQQVLHISLYICACARTRRASAYVFIRPCVSARALGCACARVALIIQHATRRHIANCDLWFHHILFDIISIKGAIFGKKLLNIKCVF
jgi:hypothetical protein